MEEKPRSSNTHLSRNSIQRTSVDDTRDAAENDRPSSRDQSRPTGRREQFSRPAPAALQEVVDRPSVGRVRANEPARSQPEQISEPVLSQQPEFREPEPVLPEQPVLPVRAEQPSLPARLSPIRIQTQPQTTEPPQTERPSRLQVG